jgi:pyruvate carboxylase
VPTLLTLPLTVSPQSDLALTLLIFLGMSGLTSQPAMGAVCMALEQTSLGTGIRHQDIQALNTYWSQVRMLYGCFEANVRASDSSVFDHEMPGGQYTNLMVRHQILVLMQKTHIEKFQASQLGLGTQWAGPWIVPFLQLLSAEIFLAEIKQKYTEANELVSVIISMLT